MDDSAVELVGIEKSVTGKCLPFRDSFTREMSQGLNQLGIS